MSRREIFRVHLAAGAALLLLAYGIVRTLWYPGAYFGISGIGRPFLVLAAVVFVVGPVLSTYVYKPGKKGLRMDLWILGGLELAAVLVAMALLYVRQPYFAVFAVDRFEAVSLSDVVDSDAARKQFGSRPGHQPRLVFASLPEDSERMQALIDETVLMGMADIDRRPEFWAPYASGVNEIKATARPLHELNLNRRQLDAMIEWLNTDVDRLLYLPLRGRAGDAAILLSPSTGYPVATLAVDPWPSTPQDSPPAGDIEQTHQGG